MSVEEYKQAFLELFKNMQDEFKSNIKAINIWHNKAWVNNEEYEISIDFSN